MVEHYAAGEGQGEEAPKVTCARGLLTLHILLTVHITNCQLAEKTHVSHAALAPLQL